MQATRRISPHLLNTTPYHRSCLYSLPRANRVRNRTLSTKIDQIVLKQLRETRNFLVAKNVQRNWKITENQIKIAPLPSIPIEKYPLKTDAGLRLWMSDPVKPIHWQTDGSIKLLNSDKQDLIDHFIQKVELRQIFLRDKVALICEGCDNGDYLAPLVAYLASKNIQDIKIYLNNGIELKIAAAAGFASCLIDSKNIRAVMANAFKDLPNIKDYEGYQKIFCPFRLPMVQRERQIIRFLHKRLHVMQADDLGLACFLIKDPLSFSLALNIYKYEVGLANENRIIYRRKLTPLSEQKLKARQENVLLEDTYLYLTAFSEERLKLIFAKLNAELVVSKIVTTASDQNIPINNMVALFRKNKLKSG